MEMTLAKINGEFEMFLPRHRAMREEWYTEQGWEKERLKSMHEHLGSKDVMYYVGAELGEMPALCAMWGADIYVFEPNYKAWPVMKHTFIVNGVRPISCFAGFASDVTQIEPKNPDRSIYGGEGWKLDREGWPIYASGEVVTDHGFNNLSQEADAHPQIKLDDYFRDRMIPPTAIAIDCEGAEWKILRGAQDILKAYRPKLWLSIHPEFMITQYNEWSYEFRKWVQSFGYKEHILDYQHELHVYYDPI
jgi:FkbM family methyltransferase